MPDSQSSDLTTSLISPCCNYRRSAMHAPSQRPVSCQPHIVPPLSQAGAPRPILRLRGSIHELGQVCNAWCIWYAIWGSNPDFGLRRPVSYPLKERRMAGSLGFEPRRCSVSKTDDFTSLSKTQWYHLPGSNRREEFRRLSSFPLNEDGIGGPPGN